MGRWNETIVNEWGIGYAPTQNAFLNHIKKQEGGRQEALDIYIKAGLIKASGEDGHLYDAFLGRLMFPIKDRTGNIVGFSGRTIAPKKNSEGKTPPKYLNTSETPIFRKSETLFGYFEAQRIAARRDLLNIVEGQPDVIRLASIGQENTVAPMGTALTTGQIGMIKRVTSKVVLIGDNDEAGQKAIVSHGEKLTQAGVNVRVMSIPRHKAKDADEYFMLPNAYDECLAANTLDFVDFMYQSKVSTAKSQNDQLAAINYICGLLVCCDETLATLYIETFNPRGTEVPMFR